MPSIAPDKLANSRCHGEPPVVDAGTPIQFRLDASNAETTTAAGRRLLGKGYILCDPQTGATLGEDDFFFRIGGGLVCDLVETRRHTASLQAEAFDPGNTLRLVRGRTGDGAEAIEVRDIAAVQTAGRLPPEVVEIIGFATDGYEAALCLWEWRNERGRRCGLRVLLAPGWTTEQL
jgi:hypothetical protein